LVLPGLVNIEEGKPVRLVTRTFLETERALQQQGIELLNITSMNLDEILAQLMYEKMKPSIGFDVKESGNREDLIPPERGELL
jgi:hypothetical protein